MVPAGCAASARPAGTRLRRYSACTMKMMPAMMMITAAMVISVLRPMTHLLAAPASSR